MKNTTKKTVYKKTKAAKKRRFNGKRVRKLLLFITIITAAIFFARSSFFIVDDIKVVGNKKYSSNDIILRTGLITGQNVFKMLGEKPKNLISFRFNDREQSVYETMPYIKSISVRPSLPKSIRIKIQERTPFAILETKGTSLLIDKEGYALEVVKDSELKKKYFKIIGTSVDSYNLGQDVKFKEESPLNVVVNFCDMLIKSDKNSKIQLYKILTNVKVSNINCITADFKDRISADFRDYDYLEYNISFFRKVYTNNINKQKGTLIFKAGTDPYFVPKD